MANFDPMSAPHDLDLVEIMGVFKRHWLFIFGSALASAALAGAASLLLTPIYRAEVLLAPIEHDPQQLTSLTGQLGAVAELAGVSVSGSRAAVATATLKSRALTERFIVDEGLMPVLFARKWNKATNSWRDPQTAPTLWDAYRLFDKDIRALSTEKKSGLVTMSIEWKDPEAAAAWANELVRRVNAQLQRDEVSEAQNRISYFQEQLRRSTVLEVQQALNRLIELDMKTVAVAHARQQFAFKTIDPAVPPKKPSRPKRLVIVAATFLLSFGLAAILTLQRKRP